MCSKVAFASFTLIKGDVYVNSDVPFKTTYGNSVSFKNMITLPVPTTTQLRPSYFDFILDNSLAVSYDWKDDARLCLKLTSQGRFWYSVLRGLGYTLDPNDTTPVSILPLWAFVKAYYDLSYPLH